jgi:hypothetical protein
VAEVVVSCNPAGKKILIFFSVRTVHHMPDFPQFFLHAYKDSPIIDTVRNAGAEPTALITNNFVVRSVPCIHLFPNTKEVYEGEDGIQKFLDKYSKRPMAQARVKTVAAPSHAEKKSVPAPAPAPVPAPVPAPESKKTDPVKKSVTSKSVEKKKETSSKAVAKPVAKKTSKTTTSKPPSK